MPTLPIPTATHPGDVRLVDRIAVSPREAALLLGVSHDTVYHFLNAGLLPSAKVRGRRLISVAALRRFVEETESRAAA